MPELAYRHPKRGKAHRWGGWCDAFTGAMIPACSSAFDFNDTWEAVPVEQVDPADLCKRCWPGVS